MTTPYINITITPGYCQSILLKKKSLFRLLEMQAVIKKIAEALRAGIKIHRPRPASSAECFGIILFVLYNFFKIVRGFREYP